MSQNARGYKKYEDSPALKQKHVSTLSKCLCVMFRKLFLEILRNKIILFELLFALLLIFPSAIIYFYAVEPFPDRPNPPLQEPYEPGIELLSFLLMGNETSIICTPDTVNMKWFVGNIFRQLQDNVPNVTLPTAEYVSTLDIMKARMYARSQNALGIEWKNSEALDSFKTPQFHIYTQSLIISPARDLFELFRRALPAFRTPKLSRMKLERQLFPSIARNSNVDISVVFTLCTLLPAIIATMPFIQTVIKERSTKLYALYKMMGCNILSYWIANLILTFASTFLVSSLAMAVWCFGYGLTGSNYFVLLLVTFVFSISNSLFVMFFVYFLKKESSSTYFFITLLGVAILVCVVHYQYTFDDGPTWVKHPFSLIPLSAYVMFIDQGVQYERKVDVPIGFGLDYAYTPELALIWLFVDCILYGALFVLVLFHKKKARKDEGILEDDQLIDLEGHTEILSIYGVSKVYKETGNRALNRIDLSIDKNEIILLLGPNGAGKTTFLNVLSGMIEPTSGFYQFKDGKASGDFERLQGIIGMCFQENALMDNLTVREHHEIFGGFRGLSKDEIKTSMERFCLALKLDRVMDVRSKDLSGGQKRKVCISLALLGNPPLVIMDEPTAGVDLESRQTIWKTIASLNDTTAIITSHALEEAEAVCSRIVVIAKGDVAFNGTPTSLRNENGCGYILRVDGDEGRVLESVRSVCPEAKESKDNTGAIILPVGKEISSVLRHIASEYGKDSYSLAVEKIEDVLVKLAQ